MKKYIYLTSVLFATVFSACDMRNSEVPETVIPKYETQSQVITIDALKTMSSTFPLPVLVDGYTNQAGNFEVRTIDNTNKAIKGVVTANDESGNIYKQFYIQDATGAITIGTNLTGVFALFRVGQEVIVELDGLCIGKYGGSFQIGGRTPYVSYNEDGSVKNASIGRMNPREFETHVFRNGKPQPGTVVPTVITTAPTITESNRSTLVKFDNVSFENAGNGVFAQKGSSYGSVNLIVGAQKILVRTSEYANFAADLIPTGTGSVICILGKYNNTIQLTVRSRGDLMFGN
ncbi:MAG: DUF5689 domain-containing protein [Paludibacter sp.]|nr:DUF5689 domain-containing protein [Paludibacter sp.]